MVWKRAKVIWEGEIATRHFTRETLQNADFNKVEMPEDAVAWFLSNESAANRLDVSYQKDMKGVRADFAFFILDPATTGPHSWIRERSRPSSLYVRRNTANAYYCEAITLGWDEEEDESDG